MSRGTPWRRRWCAVGVCFLLGACSDRSSDEALREIAGELKAVRTALHEQRTPVSGSAPAADAAAFRAALEPLREVLTVLAGDLAEVQTRQASLAEEMHRWSRLLAQTATGAGKEEAAALSKRLEALEQTMKEQDAQHRRVVGLITEALEKTSLRLESFLQRIDQLGGEKPSPPEAGEGAPKPGGSAPGGDEDGAKKEQANAGSRTRNGAAQETSLWWFGVAAVVVLAGGWFAFWLRRENVAATRTIPVDAEQPPVEGDVQELWAAAALLGEAVGRLKHNGPGTEPTVEFEVEEAAADAAAAGDSAPEVIEPVFAAERAIVEPEFEVDPAAGELFVIEETPPVADGPPFSAQGPASSAAPVRMTVQVAVDDAGRAVARVLDALAADPRVLRRPPPEVTARGQRIEVSFCVLPELPAGERGHLELFVRGLLR